METAESRAKLANAIRTMQANGQSAQIPSLVSAYKVKYQSTPAPVVPQEKTFGEKVSGGIQKIFPGQKIGQSIGTLAGLAMTPKENRKYYDTSAPSVGQVLGDAAQIALTVGTAGGVRTGVKGVSALGKASGVGSKLLNKATIETAKTVGGRAVQNTAIGAGFGATTGIKEGKDFKGVVKDTAIGAVTGLGTGLVLDGAISAYGAMKRTPIKEIAKTERELQRIENNYQKLRKNAKFSKDGNIATRNRVAKSGVLSDATDSTGTIITDKAIKRYRDLSPLNKTEGVVRNNLERLGETIDVDTLERKLIQSVYDSGQQGANLESSLNTIEREIAGYRRRATPDGKIPLTLLHDAKIDVYNTIDFNTPAEIKAYKKTLAKGLKEAVEENSSFNVKEVNETLSPYLKDIEYLESLNGRKVKGGKLGKYSARIAGNIAGGIAGGSVGGLPGSAVGTIVGGEVGDAIQGKILKGTFGNTVETALPESKILQKAVQTGNSPRAQLPAPKPGQPRIQQVSGRTINLPSRTQSAVDAQSLANLKAQKIAPPSKIPSKVSISKSVAPKKLPSKPVAKTDSLLQEARKYKSAEEFVNNYKNKPEIQAIVHQGEKPEVVNIKDLFLSEDAGTAKLGFGKGIEAKNLQAGRKVESPVLVLGKNTVIDGHTRIQQAIANREKTIPIYRVKPASEVKSQLEEVWNKANKNNADDADSFVKKGVNADALVEEAKKYKSAEEFAKAQGEMPKIKNIDGEDVTSVYFSADYADNLDKEILKNSNNEITYSNTTNEYIPNLVANNNLVAKLEDGLIYIKGQKTPNGSYIERYAPVSAKKINKLFSDESRLTSSNYEKNQKELETILDEAIREVELRRENAGRLPIIQPKSQLTDIWNKANKKAVELPKATSLEQEAKKYKSAEEFVKAQGTPVYHGTNADFTEFDPKKVGTRDSGWFGKGFYFAGTKGEAGTYGKNIMESYLKIDKPFVFSNFESKVNKGYSHADTFYLSNIAKEIPLVGKKLDVTIFDKITENGRFGKNISLSDYIKKVENTDIPYEIYEGDDFLIYEIDNPLTGRKEDLRFTKGKEFDKGELKYILFDTVYKTNSGAGGLYGVEKKISDNIGDDFTEELKKLGYDGTMQSPDGDEWVAFNPDQIKTKSQLTDIWNKANNGKL